MTTTNMDNLPPDSTLDLTLTTPRGAVNGLAKELLYQESVSNSTPGPGESCVLTQSQCDRVEHAGAEVSTEARRLLEVARGILSKSLGAVGQDVKVKRMLPVTPSAKKPLRRAHSAKASVMYTDHRGWQKS